MTYLKHSHTIHEDITFRRYHIRTTRLRSVRIKRAPTGPHAHACIIVDEIRAKIFGWEPSDRGEGVLKRHGRDGRACVFVYDLFAYITIRRKEEKNQSINDEKSRKALLTRMSPKSEICGSPMVSMSILD